MEVEGHKKMSQTEYKYHKAADSFPLLTGERAEQLSLKRHDLYFIIRYVSYGILLKFFN